MSRAGLPVSLRESEIRELEQFLKVKRLPLTRAEKQSRRHVQAIYLSHQGWSVAEIADRFNIAPRTVWRWRRIYQQRGMAGLVAK